MQECNSPEIETSLFEVLGLKEKIFEKSKNIAKGKMQGMQPGRVCSSS